MTDLYPNIHLSDHPLIRDKLSVLRSAATDSRTFRALVSEITVLLGYEATQTLPLEEIAIETPVARTTAHRLTGRVPVIVPILRAGLGMVDGMLTLLPSADVGHIGLYRDPATLAPVEYYCKLPPDVSERTVFLVDPMLATGGSADAAIGFLKQRGVSSIRMLNLIAAPEGVGQIHRAHPDVEVFCAALDERLNEHGYIVPGLGDAGDRIFGTL